MNRRGGVILLVGLVLATGGPARAATNAVPTSGSHYQAGVAKQAQAEMATREADARRLYREAVAEYQMAAQERPGHCDAQVFWAICLTELIRLAADQEERLEFIREADRQFAVASGCPESQELACERWADLLIGTVYSLVPDPARRLAALQQATEVAARGLQATQSPTLRAQLERHLGSALLLAVPLVTDPAQQRALLEGAVDHLRIANESVTVRQVLAQSGFLGIALLSLGRSTNDPARLREAAAEFEADLKLYPNEYGLHYSLAATYSLLDDAEQAGKHLAVVIDHDADGAISQRAETDPDLAPVRGSLAYTAALDRRRRRLAETQAQELVDQARQTQGTAERIGDATVATARLVEATNRLAQAIALVPDSFQSRALLATALVQLGARRAGSPDQQRRYFAAADEHFASAARCPGVEPYLYDQWSTFLLSTYYPVVRTRADREQVLTRARAVLDQGVQFARFSGLRGKLESQLGTCLVLLAQQSAGLTNQPQLYVEAVRHFQAAEGSPNLVRSVEFYESWGVALLRSGLATHDPFLFRQAIERLNKAVEISPGDAVLQYNLACAYAQLGQHDQALAHLRRSLDQDPQGALRDSAERDPALDQLRRTDAYRRAFPPRPRPSVTPRSTVSPD